MEEHMSVMKLASELFAHTSGKIVSEIGGFSVGMTPIAVTPEMKSDARTDAQKGQRVKMSTAVLLFDIIFKHKKSLAVYVNHDTNWLYGELDGVSFFIDENGKMETSATFVHHRHKAIPYVLYAMLLGPAPVQIEMFEAFAGVTNGNILKMAKGTPKDLETMAFRFCDSFYYGYAVDHKEVEVDEGTLDAASCQRILDGCAMEWSPLYLPTADAGFKTKAEDYLARSPYDHSLPIEGREKEGAAGADPIETFRQEVDDGKYTVDFPWTEEQKALVTSKSYLDTFEITEDFVEIVKAVSYTAKKILERKASGVPFEDTMKYADLMFNGMLLGKPGTGKSSFMYALSAVTGMPVYTIVFSKHTDEDIAEGATKIVDGHPQYVETDIPKFADKGGIFIFEEPNLADPSVTMGAFGQFLEQPYFVLKNGYEKTYRSPLSFVFACENTGIEGTNPNDPAFSNRFGAKWKLMDPSEEDFKEILLKKTGQSKKAVNWVYDAYKAAVNWLKDPQVGEEEVVNNLSIRTCVQTIKNMVYGQNPRRAVRNSIGNAISEASLELGDQFETEVIQNLKNPSFIIKD